MTPFAMCWLAHDARRMVEVWVDDKAIDEWLYQPVMPSREEAGELVLAPSPKREEWR